MSTGLVAQLMVVWSSAQVQSSDLLTPQVDVQIGQLDARLQLVVVVDALEGTRLNRLDVVRGITDETGGGSAANRVQLLACESGVWVSVLEEESIANTSPEELFGQNAEESGTGKGTSDVRFKSSSHSQVYILVADIQRLQLSDTRGGDEVQESLPRMCALQSAELPEVVVAGESVVTITLDVQSLQVHSEGLILTEQEVLDLRVDVFVRILLGLSHHTTVQVIEFGLDDDGSVEPVAHSQGIGAGTVLGEETKGGEKKEREC